MGTHINSFQRADCQIFENLKTKTADGLHFQKSKHRHMSSAVRRIVMKIGIGTHIDPLERVDR